MCMIAGMTALPHTIYRSRARCDLLLARAWWTEEGDVAVLADPLEAAQVLEGVPLQRRRREVEAIQRLVHRERSGAQPQLAVALIPSGALFGDQQAEELLRAPALCVR